MSTSTAPRHPLTFGNFRAYLVGRFAAVLAQYSMMIVLGWQAYNIARETMTTAGASAQLGLIGLAQFLPTRVPLPRPRIYGERRTGLTTVLSLVPDLSAVRLDLAVRVNGVVVGHRHLLVEVRFSNASISAIGIRHCPPMRLADSSWRDIIRRTVRVLMPKYSATSSIDM